MTDLAAQVTAALERGILPSVIARGGAVRVAAVGGGEPHGGDPGHGGADHRLDAGGQRVHRAR